MRHTAHARRLLGGALTLALTACMPELDRPQPRDDIRVDMALPVDLDEADVSTLDRYIVDDSRPDQPRTDLRLVDANTGKWYQADQKNCPTFCTGINRVNAASPEQAMCMSGEVRPQSGIDAGITFTYECWGACTAMPPPLPSQSYGNNCYLPNQTKDGDDTDRTVGCFCK